MRHSDASGPQPRSGRLPPSAPRFFRYFSAAVDRAEHRRWIFKALHPAVGKISLPLNQMRIRSFTGQQRLLRYNRAMNDAMNIAAAGMRTSAQQFAKSAINVVKSTIPGGNDDLSSAIVDGKTSSEAYRANIAVAKTADKMMGTLLDTLA